LLTVVLCFISGGQISGDKFSLIGRPFLTSVFDSFSSCNINNYVINSCIINSCTVNSCIINSCTVNSCIINSCTVNSCIINSCTVNSCTVNSYIVNIWNMLYFRRSNERGRVFPHRATLPDVGLRRFGPYGERLPGPLCPLSSLCYSTKFR
jgi:hypothetical protein